MTAIPALVRLPRDVSLIDDLRALPAATAWVEFKHENTDPEGMGKRVSALSNAVRAEGQDTTDMVSGVEDGTPCYFHAVLKFLSGRTMKNSTLCARLGIAERNASQATLVINKALAAGLIRVADPDHLRGGYLPYWA
jgi:hypothetical protein